MTSLYTDGGARGNPGPAGIGAVLLDESGGLVAVEAKYIGEATNNAAEYEAIISGLELAAKEGVSSLKCHLDSELVVMQINGAYRVKQAELKIKWEKVKVLAAKFEEIKFVHVRREKNKIADKLVNIVLDAVEAS